jgi:hypothetical protein
MRKLASCSATSDLPAMTSEAVSPELPTSWRKVRTDRTAKMPTAMMAHSMTPAVKYPIAGISFCRLTMG